MLNIDMMGFELHWLAGILEGEGSFMRGTPSSPGMSVLAMVSTDEDVVARVATILGVSYGVATRPDSKAHWKTVYATRIKGRGAVEAMNLLRPLMRIRRKAQIDRAVACFSVKRAFVTEETVEKMFVRAEAGETHRSIAEAYGLERSTVTRHLSKFKNSRQGDSVVTYL
jgi:hypothetical protein